MDANVIQGFRQHPADGRAPTSHRRPVRLWRLILLVASVVALVALPAFAQRADKPEPMDVMSRSWQAFYQGKFQDAVRLAEPLAQWPEAHVREEALHCIARACWDAGTRQSRDRAKSIWLTMERNFTRRNTGFAQIGDNQGRRALIGKAVMLAGEGKTAVAIKTLEPFRTVSHRYSDPSIAEALVLLAEYVIQPAATAPGRPAAPIDPKQFEDAEKCLAQADAYLKTQSNPQEGGELNKTITGPFEGAIKSARRRLADMKKETLTPGLPIFEQAQRLLKQGKHAEAIPLFREVIKLEPQADYGHQSGYLIGICALGLKRPDMAAKQWEQFIAGSPAGPHRGSAFVSLSELYLSELLDLPGAAKYADLARSALPTALADEKAGPSWRSAQYDIQTNIGLINLCLGKGDIAAEAFAAAKKLTTNKLTAEGLDALIAAAKSGKGVIPEDVQSTAAGPGAAPAPAPAGGSASPSAKVALALSMGVIYSCSGRLDKADAYFERVLGKPGVPARPGVAAVPAVPPMPGATKAQAAFAVFGQGTVLHARRKLDEAKEAFVESYKMFPQGTWVDETLYRLGTITLAQAEAKFPAPAAKDTADAGAARPKSKDQLDKEAKAEKERIAARLLARGEAAVYWQEILKRWLVKGDDGKFVTHSGRCEDAMYNLGVLVILPTISA